MIDDSEPSWLRSSRCNANGTCVELAVTDTHVLMRDSKRFVGDFADVEVLSIPKDDFKMGMEQLSVESDVIATPSLAADLGSGDVIRVTSPSSTSAVCLEFSLDEWSAFKAGALDGEFPV
jgi:hypothetical protein